MRRIKNWIMKVTSFTSIISKKLVAVNTSRADSDTTVFLAGDVDRSYLHFHKVLDGDPWEGDAIIDIMATDNIGIGDGDARLKVSGEDGISLRVGAAGPMLLLDGSRIRFLGGEFSSTGTFKLTGIPTSDPASAGFLWNDSGTLKVSAG